MADAGQQDGPQEGAPVMTSAFWFTEDVTPDVRTSMRLTSLSLDVASEFQRVQLISTSSFGKTLVLDGKTQSAQKDEFVYHEALVHPAMLQASAPPKTVFIGGGGEFATAREVLRHASVERCVMVDLDKVVCDVCREHLPEWSDGCLSDPRLEVVYADAKAHLEQHEDTYDVIVMDIADPIEAGPGWVLYTKEFYTFVKTRLNPGGVLVTQSGPGGLVNFEECFPSIHRTLKEVFSAVVPYTVDIPSFGSNWAFNVAFDVPEGEDAAAALEAAARRGPAETDALIAARVNNGELRMYDGVAHLGMCGLPRFMRKALAECEQMFTLDNPVFMY